ncbi:hypothetical protein GCM10010121_000280 [Streptomyces brasiliensis]|uniref:DUF3040 domain-containing protein n=2 Tax=Streptomyces brasiliensis TaxID=1954 RepID=A0A917K0Z4_9ACTN|nr:hypothetical protein GCM10010121_000280 [Streptomyces brasiliensis]
MAVNEQRLTRHEQLLLDGIESALNQDRALVRSMRRARKPRSVWLSLSVALLAVASVFLVVTGIRTQDPAVICAFAVLWPLTMLQGFRLLCRWTEVRGGRTVARPPS